ncbi:MAG: FecR domain-containing protein, partial [Melioribacteraceae bacterium]|nr:FecR domain-containing protein [Melioribacteraceae bacterium]
MLFILLDNSIAQNSNIKIIEYEHQSLRELAEEYLGNPDYWETILQFNNLESASELETGMKLEIPIGLVSSTLLKMDEAKNKISDANSNGAKVLTPELDTEAELNFDKVLNLKRQGEWEEAYDTLQDVLKLATESIEQVRLLRKSAADATISFTKGDVERRKPVEKLWSDAELFSKLYEADRTRTLSNSVAEITFIDLSRIRLNENSQALIQHSRIDVLKNITETKVKLVKGDAFAYLLKSPKKKFDIDIPGLDVKIRSKNFWVAKETATTKIANYEGEIELSAKDATIVVQENQGSIIPDGGVPSTPKDLLPAPDLVSPSNMTKYFEKNLQFNWQGVNDAKQYWFELASDASFQDIVYSNKKNSNNNVKISDLSTGIYFWHVASIDEFGFPGKFSQQNYLMINEDVTKPFLVITSPNNMEVTKSKSVLVQGESERGLELSINNKSVELGVDGKFSNEAQLNEGKNSIVVSSVDESGNIASMERMVFYESSNIIVNTITSENFITDKNTFILNNSEFRITGKTRPLSNVKMYIGNDETSTYADEKGFYSLNHKIENSGTDLTQVINTPANYSVIAKYKVLLDTKTPILKITSTIPKITKEESINLEGSIVNADSLFINSALISLSNKNFEKTIILVEGENNINFVAKNIAGSRVRKSIDVIKDSEPPK